MTNAPPWLAAVVGVVVASGGAFLATPQPTSLHLLGLERGANFGDPGAGDLLARRDPGRVFRGVLWILAGVAIVARVGRSVELLGPVVAAVLVVSGLTALVRLVGDRSPARWLDATFGLSEVAFGVVA